MTNHTQLRITDQDCFDILTTAVEGGYMEEFTIVRRVTHRETYETLALTLHCPDHDVEGTDTWTVGTADVRRGLEAYAAWIADSDPELLSYLGSQWREAREDGWGYFDAIGADAVLQFACFGEVVFG